MDFMLNNIAIIPARGGSKRIPKKNIIDFGGKPMIAWTIEAAVLSEKFDRIIVSTDCPETASISESFGAEVPFLRQKDFDDVTPVSVATLNYALSLQNYLGLSINNITQLMANCPLRDQFIIKEFVSEFQNKDTDFLLSCFKFGWMNPWWAFKLDKNGSHKFLFPKELKKRSQDLEHSYRPTGSIWMANLKALKKSKTFYGQGHVFYEVPWKSAVDIDEYDDLEFALNLLHN